MKNVKCVMAWIMTCVMVLSMVLVTPGLSVQAEASSKKYVKSLTVKKSVTLEKGKKVTVKPTVKVVNKASKCVIVKSKNKKIAKVSYSAKKNSITITGIKEGRTTIAVTTMAKNKKGKKISKKINVSVTNASASTEKTTAEQPGNTELTTETTTSIVETTTETTEKSTEETTENNPEVPEDTSEYTRIDWIKDLLNALQIDCLSVDNVKKDANQSEIYTYSDLKTDEERLLVETAVVYGLLKQEGTDNAVQLFHPEAAVTKEFAAITTIQGLGFVVGDTYSLDCNDIDEVAYPALVELAIDEGLLSLEDGRFYPEKKITQSNGEVILQKVKDIKAQNEISGEPIEEIEYAEDLIMDSVADITDYIVEITDTGYKITLPLIENNEQFEAGKTIYLPANADYPEGFSCHIDDVMITEGNIIIIGSAIEDIGEVFESFHIRGESSEGEVVLAEGVTFIPDENNEENLDLKLASEDNKEDGGTIGIDLKTGTLSFQRDEATISVRVENPDASFDFKGNKGKIEYLKVYVDNHVTISGELSGSGEKSFELFSKAVPIGKGFKVELKYYIVFSASGSVSVTAKIDSRLGISVNKNHNTQNISNLDISNNLDGITVAVKGGLKGEILLTWLDEDILAIADVSGEMGTGLDCTCEDGVNMSGESLACISSVIYSYLKFGCGLNEKTLMNKLKIEASYNVWDKDNSPARTEGHYESNVTTGTCGKVESCTAAKYKLEGYVYDENNTLVGGAAVNIYNNENEKRLYKLISNEQGYYSCSLANGDYNVEAVYGGGIKVRKNITVDNPESDLKLDLHSGLYGCGTGYEWIIDEEGLFYLKMNAKLNDWVTEEVRRDLVGNSCKDSIKTAQIIGKTGEDALGEILQDCDNMEKIDLSKLDTSAATDMRAMFAGCSSLTELDLSNLNTCNVTDMGYMFSSCSSLKKLDLSILNTGNVTNMYGMFNVCSSLTELDLSNFHTGKVTDMSGMFYGCDSLENINLNEIETTNVEDMYMMFGYCSSLPELDLSNFDTGNVKNMYGMFSGCSSLTELNLSSFNTRNVTNMNNMFSACSSLKELDLSSFDTSNVIYMGGFQFNNSQYMGMFDYCTSLTELDLTNFDTSKVEDMSYMFRNCKALTKIDLSSFDTGQVVDMSYMFSGCTSLENLDLQNFVSENVTDMSYMFYNCKSLMQLDVSDFDVSKVEKMNDMFFSCSALEELNLQSFVPGNVTNMSWMFYKCDSLMQLDVSNFDVSKVEDMDYMFYGCTSLEELNLQSFEPENAISLSNMFYDCSALKMLDIRNFNTAEVESMENMFYNCSALEALDLSSFDTSKVTDMGAMFYNCSALETLDLSNFDTGKVTDMGEMFYNCGALADLDLSSFNTSNVEYMFKMFSKCSSLTGLDLSNFDTSKVTNMSYMFSECGNLQELEVSSFTIGEETDTSWMFYKCNSSIIPDWYTN